MSIWKKYMDQHLNEAFMTEMSQSETERLEDAGFAPENGESGFPYIKELDNGDILKIKQDGTEKWVISCTFAKSGKTEEKKFDILNVAIANSDRFEDEPEELEEQVNPSPASTPAVTGTAAGDAAPANVDLTKINPNQLSQLKNLVNQKDMIDKKIDLLKKQITSVKESLSEAELNEDSVKIEENAKQLIKLFNDLNLMEKRHERFLNTVKAKFDKERDDLHLQIRDLMKDQEREQGIKIPMESVAAIKESFSFKKYFIDNKFAKDVDTLVESLNDKQKIVITNRIIDKLNGNTLNESFVPPEKTAVLETIKFYGEQNFKCRFIKEALNVLTEMAVRQVKSAFILRWKDGTKPQQYLYPFDKADKKSIEVAKAKAVEAAEKKIQAGKNDVRVENGITSETITGEALKLGRNSGTTKKELVAKANKEIKSSDYMLITFRAPAEAGLERDEEEDKIKGFVPEILHEIKNLDRDLLDFEEDFSEENGIDISIDLYKTLADATRNAMINERTGMASLIVEIDSEDIIPLGTAKVNSSDEIDYDKDVLKLDDKEVKGDKLVDKETDDEDEDEKPAKIVKKPTEAQLAARKKFAAGSKGLDKKTQDALNSRKNAKI